MRVGGVVTLPTVGHLYQVGPRALYLVSNVLKKKRKTREEEVEWKRGLMIGSSY